MKIENLKVGMVLKNYAELCSTLELKPKKGGARQNQLKWIEEHVDFTRAGHKYIVDMIKKNYVEPQQDNRGGANNVVDYPQLKVRRTEWSHIGVYKITNGFDIYIGSTIAGFRKRFAGHYYGESHTTIDIMADPNTEFTIIEQMNDEDEPSIRDRESYWINQYRQNHAWNVLNVNDAWSLIKNSEVENDFVDIKIRVRVEDYSNTMQMLYEVGLAEEGRQ